MVKTGFDPEHQTALLVRLKNGDQAAFADIHDQYRDRIYHYACKVCKSVHLAEEIIQDVFVRIWQKREQINPELHFGFYIQKITLNHILNHIKKASNDRVLRSMMLQYMEEHKNEIEEQLYEKELGKIYQDAIEQLPQQRKLAYEMSRMQHLSHEEIGEKMGISKHTVKNHIVEATKFIRGYVVRHRTAVVWILAISDFIDTLK